MKLFYFGVRGRAETARLLLRLGAVEFEDIQFSEEEWGVKYKKMGPSGQCPWLHLDDDSILTQSNAIYVYCAGLAGFLPSDTFQVARTIELFNTIEDMWQPIGVTQNMADAEEKLAALKALIEADGAVTKKMNTVEGLVASRPTPFYCGDDMTLADIHLFCVLSFFRSGFITGMAAEFTDTFEKTAALRSKVASMPNVRELYTGVVGFEPEA